MLCTFYILNKLLLKTFCNSSHSAL